MEQIKMQKPENSRIRLYAQLFFVPLAFCLSFYGNVYGQQPAKKANSSFKAMTWNIWHGGREDGKEVGPKRVIEVIKSSGADVVAMQETYGSGEIISKGLGFHFQPRGTNLSIHSRFPILEDISVFQEFKCVGSLIELPNKKKVAYYCIWLPYSDDIWLPNSRLKKDANQLQKACQVSANDLKKIWEKIQQRLNAPKYKDVSIIVAGDFNSMSHLDYTPVAVDQFGRNVSWNTSKVLLNAGFRDSYREANPVIDRKKDSTWSPKFPKQEQDRIDFIYYRSKDFHTKKSDVIRTHPVKFPSDHAAVLTNFEMGKRNLEESTSLRTVSYNIRRGHGSDNKTNLDRTVEVLRKLNPDLVGLQEVDLGVRRSGKINQAKFLGQKLGMHAYFCKFMDYQGGDYGMAILSKYPFVNIEEVILPKGNETRKAIAAKILLENGQQILLVNIHYDWVKDDTFRFGQAKTMKEYLDKQTIPYVLLGDFNDGPKSRTIQLTKNKTLHVKKTASSPFTYPATEPNFEIDFIFAAPKNRWTASKTRVIAEKLASDHRPVFSVLTLSSNNKKR